MQLKMMLTLNAINEAHPIQSAVGHLIHLDKQKNRPWKKIKN